MWSSSACFPHRVAIAIAERRNRKNHNGIESRTFASAEALLESGSAQSATCLLLDIHLGGISGIELQRRLAASDRSVLSSSCTANDNEATRNDAMDAGCIAYLRKPFARDVLMDAIGKAVPNRRGVTRTCGVVTSELAVKNGTAGCLL